MTADSEIERTILNFLNQATAEAVSAKIKDDPLFGAPRGKGISLTVAARIVAARPDGGFTSIQQIDGVDEVGPDTMHDILYTFWTEHTENMMTSEVIAWTASRSSTFSPITGSDYMPIGTEVEFNVQSPGDLLVEFGVDLMAEHTGQQAPNFVLVGVAVDGAKPVDSDAIYTGGGFGEATSGFKSDIYSSNARLIVVELATGPHSSRSWGSAPALVLMPPITEVGGSR